MAAVNREALLEQFGVMTEEHLASLLGVEVKTLKNRSEKDLPPFSKTGGKRLFFKEDVLAYLRRGRNG